MHLMFGNYTILLDPNSQSYIHEAATLMKLIIKEANGPLSGFDAYFKLINDCEYQLERIKDANGAIAKDWNDDDINKS